MLNPKELNDYPDRMDLFVAVTMNTSLWSAAHGSGSFFSERFSRHGEICFSRKLNSRNGFDGEIWSVRGELKDTINDVLILLALGCVIRGGTGRTYSYIDLALTNVDEAFKKLHKHACLHFGSAYKLGNRIGAWPNFPAPPMIK